MRASRPAAALLLALALVACGQKGPLYRPGATPTTHPQKPAPAPATTPEKPKSDGAPRR